MSTCMQNNWIMEIYRWWKKVTVWSKENEVLGSIGDEGTFWNKKDKYKIA